MKAPELNICLWFDDQAEEAVNFYTSIFPDSATGAIARFGKEGFEFHGKTEGTVMTIAFSIGTMKFTALNGGPLFKFNEAVSIIIYCETQAEIDFYWSRLTEKGEEQACGWLKDKFGVSWQITPSFLPDYLQDKDSIKRSRVEQVLFQMKKFDISKLQNAYNGQ